MGSFAPKHVRMADEGFQPAPPFRLQDNDNSLIETTDMVFVDAISTGFSRTAPGVSPAPFHGQDGDIRAFGEFINGWLGQFNRWSSPKYLMGESYGTIRSAGLAAELQTRHGVDLNGIVLISSLLTYQTLSPSLSNDVAWAANIETFTADAWYHKKLPADLQSKTLKQVVDESRTFAWGEYSAALTKGNTLTATERQAVAAKLARLSGLTTQFILAANLRVSAERFRKELLRDKRLTLGRLDGRYTSLDADAAGERQEFDPSNQALQGPYTAMFQDYVRNELKSAKSVKVALDLAEVKAPAVVVHHPDERAGVVLQGDAHIGSEHALGGGIEGRDRAELVRADDRVSGVAENRLGPRLRVVLAAQVSQHDQH